MKAIAVRPGVANSVHLRDIPRPSLDDVPGGRGVLVKLLHVGVDATDKEINEAQYGTAPPGCDYLVLGHESFGIVEAVGPNVHNIKPGDYVTATVRRPGKSIQDLIGTYDMTSDDTYYERGICLRHGFLTEYYVDDPEYIVKVPAGLRKLGVLMEPISVAEKAVAQVYEIQRRLRVWRPRVAYVAGAGQIGLLCTMLLRQRGLEVYTLARSEPPTLNAEIATGMGATYVSTTQTPVHDLAKKSGPPDIIIECTGHSGVVFTGMEILGKNGVLVLTSITGGQRHVTVPADKVNLDFVLGNKCLVGTVNANREYFEMGVKSLATAELEYPGLVGKILTHKVQGLENYQELMRLLVEVKSALKVYAEIAPLP
jgi:threonine dehydrogenase-like Zn-dependent dehydrogenase